MGMFLNLHLSWPTREIHCVGFLYCNCCNGLTRLCGISPSYLQELRCPVSALVGHMAFRSSSGGEPLDGSASNFAPQHRAFSVIASYIINAHPLKIWLLTRSNVPLFNKLSKSVLCRHGFAGSASEWMKSPNGWISQWNIASEWNLWMQQNEWMLQ